MVGRKWLEGIHWEALDMRPQVFEPADIDVSPYAKVAEPTDLAQCDIVLVFVSGGVAEKAIKSIFGGSGQDGPTEVLDFSSSGPEAKKVLSEWCSIRGASYTDVTILGAIAAGGLSTPLAIAGSISESARGLLSASGGRLLELDNGQAGDAARLKLVRSVVTKGLEALACEARILVDEFNLGDDYHRVFNDFESGSFTTIMGSMVATHLDHRDRRGKEVREVISLVKSTGRESALLEAVAQNYEKGAFRGIDRAEQSV